MGVTDAYNNTGFDYRGTIQLSADDAQATPPLPHPVTGSQSGVVVLPALVARAISQGEMGTSARG